LASSIDAPYGPVDPNDVCDLVKNGSPDLYNARPKRYITKDEAKYRGWPHFWEPYKYSPCKTGHNAARYVTNIAACVDCRRVKEGLLPIYPTQAQLEQMNRTGPGTAVAAPRDKSLPDDLETRFLAQYAQTKDFEKAAGAVQTEVAEFISRLSYKPIFRKAVHQLETDLEIKKTEPVTAPFAWDDEKRKVLIITYINTGEMTKALAAIKCSPYQFHKEVSDNPSFRSELEDAEPFVHQLYKWTTESLAVKGDARSLMRMAASLFPDQFGERLKLDMNVKAVRSPDAIQAEFTQILERLDRKNLLRITETVEGDFRDVTSAGTGPDSEVGGGGGPVGEHHDNSDLV
jgi:hypothetical protein